LHLAASGNNGEVVELLLADKSRINARNNNDETPISMAKKSGAHDAMEALHRHGVR